MIQEFLKTLAAVYAAHRPLTVEPAPRCGTSERGVSNGCSRKSTELVPTGNFHRSLLTSVAAT